MVSRSAGVGARGGAIQWVLRAIAMLIATLLVCVAPVSTSRAQDDGTALPPVPDAAAIEAMGATTPDDPFDAATFLVDRILGPDPGAAAIGSAELLRRAAIPIVSSDGPVVAMPDHLALLDQPLYVEWTADLARDARVGQAWTLQAFTDGLKGIGVLTEEATPAAVSAGLAGWGKAPDAPPESIIAGAAVRALGARRGDVYTSDGDPGSLLIDTLQATLILSHLQGDAYEIAASTGVRSDGRTVVRGLALMAASDPCAALVSGVKTVPGTVTKDLLKDQLKGAIKKRFAKALQNTASNGIDVADKALDIVSLLLLLAGTDFKLETDKDSTHYKHQGGSRKEHVHLKATATFESSLAQKNLDCYRLAGIKVPPNGPMAGFKVAWMLNQAQGSYSRFGMGMNPRPLMLQGKHLAVVKADAYKVCDRLSCGETTKGDGLSTLELYPPVELKPDKGALLNGKVRVRASLSQDDMPSLFKVTDPKSLIKRESTMKLGVGQADWAVKKIVDLAISYLKRAGLPSRSLTIDVGYHGNDVYVVKGSGKAFLFYVWAPFSVDLYTCEGLRKGVWKGTATFKADRTLLGDAAVKYFHVNLPQGWEQRNPNVNKELDLLGDRSFPWLPLIDPYLQALFEVTRRPREATVDLGTGPTLIAEHLDGVVGNVELYVGDTSLDVAMETFGLGTAEFPIVGKPDDSRCDGGGPDDYYFEDA